MKYVNLKTGEISNGEMSDSGSYKPYTFNYNEEDNRFEYSNWIELDDQMVAPMIILNKKGYETEWCCSGHIYEAFIGSYVRFTEPIFKLRELMCDSKYTLDPNLFDIDNDYKTVRIKEKMKDESDPVLGQRIINRFCEELLEWAIKIPNRNDCHEILNEKLILTKEDEARAYGEALREAK